MVMTSSPACIRASSLLPFARSAFGIESFLPLQEAVIDAELAGHDVLAVLPTGGGKSLCYQLPALTGAGLVVVVSPLRALMKDQCDALAARSMPAALIDCETHHRNAAGIYEAVRQNRLRLLYVSPERCESPELLATIRKAPLTAFAIDEAHCISQWGHDFRPAYAKLGMLRVLHPRTPIWAFTATATPDVRTHICDSLSLINPEIHVGDFDRPNLTLRCIERDPLSDRDLLRVLFNRADEGGTVWPQPGRGIVYCPTRAETERIAQLLCESSFNARAYHAGLDDWQRRDVQDWFSCGTGVSPVSRVVCATVAFGMGVNVKDVRLVIHNGMPSSIELYHQEIGRAGRDGLPAECVCLWHENDLDRWCDIFESESEQLPDDAIDAKCDAVQTMHRFCLGFRDLGSVHPPNCRHSMLVEHFGQRFVPPPCQGGGQGAVGCNACDVCLSSAPSASPRETQ